MNQDQARQRWEKPVEVDANGCWLWTGRVNESGYGRYGARLAHRVFWERHRGAIPVGLELDHLCRVKLCVNPDHLEPVTGSVNVRRASVAQTHCKHGHEFTPENTYLRPDKKGRIARVCRACGRDKTRRYLERKRVTA